MELIRDLFLELFEPRNEKTASSGGYLKDTDHTIPDIAIHIKFILHYRLDSKTRKTFTAKKIKEFIMKSQFESVYRNYHSKSFHLRGWRLKPT